MFESTEKLALRAGRTWASKHRVATSCIVCSMARCQRCVLLARSTPWRLHWRWASEQKLRSEGDIFCAHPNARLKTSHDSPPPFPFAMKQSPRWVQPICISTAALLLTASWSPPL